jgi:hypothetical protein
MLERTSTEDELVEARYYEHADIQETYEWQAIRVEHETKWLN